MTRGAAHGVPDVVDVADVGDTVTGAAPSRGLDLRMPALALVAWGAALLALLAPVWWLLLVLAAAVVRSWQRWRRGRPVLTLLTWTLAGAAVAGSALLRVDAVQSGPVAELAREQAVVRLELVTTSDPVVRPGRFGDVVVVRARVEQDRHDPRLIVTVRGVGYRFDG